MRVRYYYYAGALLFLAGCCFADTTTLSFPGLQMKQSGWVAFDGGEIVQATNDANHSLAGASGETIGKIWMEDLLFKYKNEFLVTERMRVALSIQGQINYNYPYFQSGAGQYTKQPQITFTPDRAEAMYTIGDFQKPTLQFGFGYFPFKTDPDAKNLGDYLFRTGTYPVYVVNSFDWTYARLLGLRVTSNLFDGFHQDLLLTSSTLLPPLLDGSLTYLASYSFGKVLDIGAGVSFVDLFPVDGQITTPTSQTSTAYIKPNGDTGYYTFAATKPMVRFAFDPKTLIPCNLFGREDLRLYGEACVTGWEDYGASIQSPLYTYANRYDRLLYMAGFDFPTFKTMDVLSIEVEHYPNRYPNDDSYIMGQSNENSLPLPLPQVVPNDPNLPGGKVYPWFWSVYAKKTFLGRFSIIAQFARDHMRPFNNDPQYTYTGDVFEQKGDWWWNVRLRADY
jgi:hypothetical protein